MSEDHEPMSSICASCRARILWVRHESGRYLPLDHEPVPDGPLVIVGAWALPVAAAVNVDPLKRYRCHFATCPDAEKYRRGRKAARRKTGDPAGRQPELFDVTDDGPYGQEGGKR